MQIEQRPIEKLIPYINNSRTHSDEQVAQIAASIKEFGWTNPIMVDGDNGIIAGHGRLLAARKLGLTEVPVIELAHMTDHQKRAYIIADNKLALNAGWDENLLALELGELKAEGFDIGLAGFSELEFEALQGIGGGGGTEGLTDPDDVPDPPEEPVTVLGDVWILGNHRLMCGDSATVDSARVLMGTIKADMVFTDPPYGVSYQGKTKDALEIENDNLTPIELADAVTSWFSVIDTVTRDGAYLMATVPPGPLHLIFAQDWVSRGWLRQIMVWNKSAMVMGHSEYHYKHEPILFGWKPGNRHKNPDRTRTTVWDFEKPAANREHPTMKPVAMWEFGITNHTNQKDVVFDPFGGSGTSIIACEKTGRFCYSMEISPQYCDVIVNRWQNFTGQQAILEATDQTFEEVKNGGRA